MSFFHFIYLWKDLYSSGISTKKDNKMRKVIGNFTIYANSWVIYMQTVLHIYHDVTLVYPC